MQINPVLLVLGLLILAVGPIHQWLRTRSARLLATRLEQDAQVAATQAEEERARLEAEKPPIRYTDPDGVGWRAPPDWHEPYTPDEGQHDMWKREMRLWLWRMRTGHEASRCNLKDAGIAVRDQWQNAGFLLPAGSELASAARRLGFLRLARAATGEDPQWGTDELRMYYDRHQAAARALAQELYTGNAERAKTWDTVARGPFNFDSEETTFSMLDFGSFMADPFVPDGKALQPLKPFELPTASADWRAFTRQT